jgi:hypothetical protein
MNEIERLQFLAGIKSQINEEPETGDSVIKTVVGHVDDEPSMIRNDLYKIGKYSVELYRMLGEIPNGDLPNWWTNKIARASEYISAAKHYLEAELHSHEQMKSDPGPDVTDDSDPSGVS